MTLTVIVCTYQRCHSLAKALESVAGSTLPNGVGWEVLVVDNNSSDRTRQVVEDFCCRYPGRFRYLLEPHQGKSHALNAGIREACGDVLVFTDDDVTVEPTWLQNLTAPLQHDEWAGVGGRVLPERNFSPPPWLSLEGRFALGPLALFDFGTQALPLSGPPFGNNMAFRKEIFAKYGGFRKDLGPPPASEFRGEDTEFGQRLLDAGERLRYEPSAVVYHAVPEERVQKKYFLDWWFDKSRAEIRQSGLDADALRVAGVPLYLLRRFVMWILRWAVAIGPAARFHCRLKLWQVAAYITESHRISIRS
jgi:glycosyltransferase involved in cell wall biosynthesis